MYSFSYNDTYFVLKIQLVKNISIIPFVNTMYLIAYYCTFFQRSHFLHLHSKIMIESSLLAMRHLLSAQTSIRLDYRKPILVERRPVQKKCFDKSSRSVQYI